MSSAGPSSNFGQPSNNVSLTLKLSTHYMVRLLDDMLCLIYCSKMFYCNKVINAMSFVAIIAMHYLNIAQPYC